MKHEDLVRWLREQDESRLGELWLKADEVRRINVGEAVHLRGLIELSNNCVRNCWYCGLRAEHRELERYRLSIDEIIACAHEAVAFGYGTVVMQSGEDYALKSDWIADVIRRLKAETDLAVTLSLGERTDDELVAWRKAGADRYLLRFETSDPALYRTIHPDLPGKLSDRIAMLHRLRDIGYEIGSGVMVGIPGQTYDILARDIETFAEIGLDMIGVGPWLPHPATPLGDTANPDLPQAPPGEQTPNSEDMTYKVIALTRIMCPKANIPSTTALATVNKATGREFGLQRGANIVMPNVTPIQYRSLYEIYPSKACVNETAADCQGCIKGRITSIGREIGTGRGDSPNYRPSTGNTDKIERK